MSQTTTSNEHYGRLNQIFDERSKVLREMGFKYEQIEAYQIAVFAHYTRVRKYHYTLAATFVMHADERSWNERLADFRD